MEERKEIMVQSCGLDGDDYYMFWLSEKSKEKLMRVLVHAKLWLPENELKRIAAELYLEIGLELDCLSETEKMKTKFEIGMNSN